MTRSRAPFSAAVRLYNSSNIRFRNVHVNAESGLGICDTNGCGTYLRASKFPLTAKRIGNFRVQALLAWSRS